MVGPHVTVMPTECGGVAIVLNKGEAIALVAICSLAALVLAYTPWRLTARTLNDLMSACEGKPPAFVAEAKVPLA